MHDEAEGGIDHSTSRDEGAGRETTREQKRRKAEHERNEEKDDELSRRGARERP